MCITTDVITGMDDLKLLSCFTGYSRHVSIVFFFFFFEKHVSIVKTIICAPDLYDPFMVVVVIC